MTIKVVTEIWTRTECVVTCQMMKHQIDDDETLYMCTKPKLHAHGRVLTYVNSMAGCLYALWLSDSVCIGHLSFHLSNVCGGARGQVLHRRRKQFQLLLLTVFLDMSRPAVIFSVQRFMSNNLLAHDRTFLSWYAHAVLQDETACPWWHLCFQLHIWEKAVLMTCLEYRIEQNTCNSTLLYAIRNEYFVPSRRVSNKYALVPVCSQISVLFSAWIPLMNSDDKK